MQYCCLNYWRLALVLTLKQSVRVINPQSDVYAVNEITIKKDYLLTNLWC